MIPAFHPLVLRLEARLLRSASAVITVSPSWAEDLRSRFNVGSKAHVVTNAYVPEELSCVKPNHFGHFAIVYAGIFMLPERSIVPILKALKVLKVKRQPREFYFYYYGPHEQHVREEADNLGVAARVKIQGRVSRAEALSATRGADINVVITSVLEKASARVRGWIPAKLFEAIGLRKPVLLIAPRGTDVECIAESTGLAGCFTGTDIEGIAGFIERAISGPAAGPTMSDSLTWESNAKKLDRILRQEISGT
jgi:glycosyltransferase involved in cell wall biosynthesis